MSYVTYRNNKYWLNRKVSHIGQLALDVLAEDPDAKPNKLIARAYKLAGCKTLNDLEGHWCSVETTLRDVRLFKEKVGVQYCKVSKELWRKGGGLNEMV